jgi:hypothetical protein
MKQRLRRVKRARPRRRDRHARVITGFRALSATG